MGQYLPLHQRATRTDRQNLRVVFPEFEWINWTAGHCDRLSANLKKMNSTFLLKSTSRLAYSSSSVHNPCLPHTDSLLCSFVVHLQRIRKFCVLFQNRVCFVITPRLLSPYYVSSNRCCPFQLIPVTHTMITSHLPPFNITYLLV
jgi:hypothetical protein